MWNIIIVLTLGICSALLTRWSTSALGSLAEVVLLVPWFWWWSKHRDTLKPVWGFIVASLVFDALAARTFPLSLTVGVVAGTIFWATVVPSLSQSSVLMRLVGTLLWLLIWRFVRIGVLAAVWLLGFESLPPSSIHLSELAFFLMLGIIVWGIVESVATLRQRSVLFRKQRV